MPAARSSFGSALFSSSTASKKKEGGVSEELGIPCEDECALTKFPNLPESVHPGVLSGKAQMDLLQHAKENGECRSMDSFFLSRKRFGNVYLGGELPLSPTEGILPI